MILSLKSQFDCALPSLVNLHSTRCIKRTQDIIKDTSRPGHSMFQLLSSGGCYRSIEAKTNRLKYSFYPTAITTLRTIPKILYTTVRGSCNALNCEIVLEFMYSLIGGWWGRFHGTISLLFIFFTLLLHFIYCIDCLSLSFSMSYMFTCGNDNKLLLLLQLHFSTFHQGP